MFLSLQWKEEWLEKGQLHQKSPTFGMKKYKFIWK